MRVFFMLDKDLRECKVCKALQEWYSFFNIERQPGVTKKDEILTVPGRKPLYTTDMINNSMVGLALEPVPRSEAEIFKFLYLQEKEKVEALEKGTNHSEVQLEEQPTVETDEVTIAADEVEGVRKRPRSRFFEAYSEDD